MFRYLIFMYLIINYNMYFIYIADAINCPKITPPRLKNKFSAAFNEPSITLPVENIDIVS